MILTSDTKRSILILFVLAACLITLFWPGIAHSEVPAFRDAYHFYYPQAVWLREQASLGQWFPQWNHLAGLGVSVPGQVSSALYYPLRVLWFLPGCSVEQCYSIYICVHLLLAAVGMRLAARRLDLNAAHADLAGVAYALSCPVFFQHNNLIYLTSATWIGFALSAMFEGCRRVPPKVSASRWSPFTVVLVFSAAGSLMLLGGDPHTLANCWILSVLAIPVLLWSSRQLSLAKRWGLLLLLSIVLTTLLTSIQWLPAWRWAQHSERTSQTLASTAELEEVFSKLVPDHRAVMEFAQLDRETRSDLPYDFSVPPWYLSTLIWPQLGGHYLPENSRLFSALPAEGRMWAPSLSIGILPMLCLGLLLVPRYFKEWFRNRKLCILVGLCLFALLAAFGNYSITWLLREFLKIVQLERLAASIPPDHYFSLYGWLTHIPGYDAFRFPGKWTVWFAAGMSLLAASLLQNLAREPNQRLRTQEEESNLASQTRRETQGDPTDRGGKVEFPLALGISLILGSVMLFIVSFFPLGSQLNFRRDGWLGQTVLAEVQTNLRWALVAPVTIGVIILWRRRLSVSALLALTLMEMTWTAAAWVSFVPAPAPQAMRELLPENSRVWSSPLSGRFQYPYEAESDISLAEAQTRYQDQFLLAKLNELPQLVNLGSIVSVDPLLTARLKLWLSTQDRMHEDQPALDRTLAALGMTHRLIRGEDSDAAGEVASGEALRWKVLPDSRPFCEWVVDGLPVPVEQAGPEWQWTAAGFLDIQGQPPTENAVLLIRQLNDGRWRAIGSEEQGGGGATDEVPDNYIGTLTPFIELTVPPQIRHIRLRRQGW